jgi:hypothetical protein
VRPPAAQHAGENVASVGLSCRGVAFGLAIESEIPLTGLHPESARVPRRSTVLLASAGDIEARWMGVDAERVSEQRYTDGRTALSIDFSEAAGFRIFSFGFGTYLVTPDGLTVLCAPADPAQPLKAERVVLAQALPLAACLQGLEVLHASAVTIGGRAFGLTGASGQGKTTLAMHLVARGFPIFTDDVLAIEPRVRDVLAHPGPSVLHLDPSRAEDPLAGRLGTAIGSSEKTHLAVSTSQGAPIPLGACYFVEREEAHSELRIERVAQPDPRSIIGNAFLAYHAHPARLIRMLDASARIASSVPLFRLLAPMGVPPERLAELVETHAREEAGG